METVDRRKFMKSVAVAAAMSKSELVASPGESGLVLISTWPHGKPANEKAAEVFNGGGSLLDTVEHGINVTENDPAVTSVGYGGLPNEDGIVELDAAIMDGTRHHAGAVASLRNIKNPISVARKVLEENHSYHAGGRWRLPIRTKNGISPGTIAYPRKPEEMDGLEGRSQTSRLLEKSGRKP